MRWGNRHSAGGCWTGCYLVGNRSHWEESISPLGLILKSWCILCASPSILIQQVNPEREKVLASPTVLPSRVQLPIVSESLKCFGEKWKKRFQNKQCVGSTLRAALSGMLPQFILSDDGRWLCPVWACCNTTCMLFIYLAAALVTRVTDTFHRNVDKALEPFTALITHWSVLPVDKTVLL